MKKLDDDEIMSFVSKYTLVSNERLQNVFCCIEHVAKNNIPGDFIEIGVFKGGVIMAMALKCQQLGIERRIHAYDTFEGMTQPTAKDEDFNGNMAADILPIVMCYSGFAETKQNIDMCNYPLIEFHKGDILKTELNSIPSEVALLRLDTDWYDSTKFELENFEPKVSANGCIIIDDYGHWKGCKLAVDEFLNGKNTSINTIDYTGIWWNKN
jgi:O-methyltransferase